MMNNVNTMNNVKSIVGATSAVASVPIPAQGRRIYYRCYLIHAEIPAICYVIYGRNPLGQLTELGAARSFTDAMLWVDRHIGEMQQLKAVAAAPDFTPAGNALPPQRAAA